MLVTGVAILVLVKFGTIATATLIMTLHFHAFLLYYRHLIIMRVMSVSNCLGVYARCCRWLLLL